MSNLEPDNGPSVLSLTRQGLPTVRTEHNADNLSALGAYVLHEAKAAGCVSVSGVEMFVRQAAAQFEMWTGQPAPAERFRDVVLDHLSR